MCFDFGALNCVSVGNPVGIPQSALPYAFNAVSHMGIPEKCPRIPLSDCSPNSAPCRWALGLTQSFDSFWKMRKLDGILLLFFISLTKKQPLFAIWGVPVQQEPSAVRGATTPKHPCYGRSQCCHSGGPLTAERPFERGKFCGSSWQIPQKDISNEKKHQGWHLGILFPDHSGQIWHCHSTEASSHHRVSIPPLIWALPLVFILKQLFW